MAAWQQARLKKRLSAVCARPSNFISRGCARRVTLYPRQALTPPTLTCLSKLGKTFSVSAGLNFPCQGFGVTIESALKSKRWQPPDVSPSRFSFAGARRSEERRVGKEC